MNSHIIELQNKMKYTLTEKRYRHTLGVMYTSASLAMRFDSDIDKAMIAGVLHDCAKCIPTKEKLDICARYDIPVSNMAEQKPDLLHAELGALLAEKEYGIDDPQILSAIRYHTVGRPDMTKLEKIIYLADYIEPGRKSIPGMDEARKKVFDSLDHGLIFVTKQIYQYLIASGKEIMPGTLETLLYYENINRRDS